MIAEGTRLGGRYEVREHLGGGGAGDVWLAVDTSLERFVAVKVMRNLTDKDYQRFDAEIRAQAPLSHPSIVRVFDTGTHDDAPFLVLAYVEGSALSDLVTEGPLPVSQVTTWGAQIADALAHAHAHGVVHRDVKPSNVLIDEQGRAHLTDFGIAHRPGGERLTATDGFIGSAAYVAPEQVDGSEVTPAADVYGLGLVLLEALTGRQEYTGSPIEAAMARLHRAPQIPTDLPSPWPRLLADMVATDPAERPTAGQVAKVLARQSPTRTAETARSSPVAAETTALDDSASTAQGAPTTQLPPGQRSAGQAPSQPAARPPARQARSPWGWVAVVGLAAVALVLGAVVLASPGGERDVPDPGEPDTLEEALDNLEETIQP